MYSDITPFTKYSGTPSCLKANGYFFLVPDQPTQKENLFLDLNFSASLLRINAASTVRFPGKSVLRLIDIHQHKQLSIQNLECMSNSFIPVYEFGLMESPFRLIICTNELNIHSSGNLPSNKILNMAVKEFKQGSQ